MKSRFLSALIVATVAVPAFALPVVFSGSSTGPGGVPVSASASFDIVGNLLTIQLANTSPSNSGQDVPGSTLSGLFFSVTGNPTLTPQSATITAGSIVQGSTCNPGPCNASTTNVGGEFGYGTSVTTTEGGSSAAFPNGADRGISSSGYLTTGIPSNIGNFNTNGTAGTNLDDPASLDGINFGIISAAAGFNPNGGLAAVPLVSDRVTFVLTGAAGLTLAAITNVSFQYGTSLSELNVIAGGAVPPSGNPLPEPTTVALFGIGLLALAARRRRS